MSLLAKKSGISECWDLCQKRRVFEGFCRFQDSTRLRRESIGSERGRISKTARNLVTLQSSPKTLDFGGRFEDCKIALAA